MANLIKIGMIGDVAGKTGRFILRRALPGLIASEGLDFVVANGENIAGGIGITPDLADEMRQMGVNVITSGNHIWRKREICRYIEEHDHLLRPHNYVEGQPGTGVGVYRSASGDKIGVINLSGQIFMDVNPDNPYVAADKAVAALKQREVRIIVVDFHAEATSEKRALGYYLDGRVSGVLGTHTHVQTADDEILPGGTAYLTDLGMSGPHDSIIGMRKDLVVDKFVTGMPQSFKPAKNGPRLQGAIIEVDIDTGKAVSIKRVNNAVEDSSIS